MSLKHYKLVLLCVVLLLNSGCIRFAKISSGVYNGNPSYSKGVKFHRVKAGETLYSIAFEYGHDHRDLAQWNRIKKPYTIYPKQKLRVSPRTVKAIKKYSANNKRHNARKKTTDVQKRAESYPSTIKWSWPTKGKLQSTFLLSDPGRRGIDISGKKGQPIRAAAAGHVVYSGSGLRGYGNLIILKHNDTYFSAYAHTENVGVKEQEKVKLGQQIADMGSTSSNKTKLHFEIRRSGKPVNPLGYLPKRH